MGQAYADHHALLLTPHPPTPKKLMLMLIGNLKHQSVSSVPSLVAPGSGNNKFVKTISRKNFTDFLTSGVFSPNCCRPLGDVYLVGGGDKKEKRGRGGSKKEEMD